MKFCFRRVERIRGYTVQRYQKLYFLKLTRKYSDNSILYDDRRKRQWHYLTVSRAFVRLTELFFSRTRAAL
jgi:hypothetical protein